MKCGAAAPLLCRRAGGVSNANKQYAHTLRVILLRAQTAKTPQDQETGTADPHTAVRWAGAGRRSERGRARGQREAAVRAPSQHRTAPWTPAAEAQPHATVTDASCARSRRATPDAARQPTRADTRDNPQSRVVTSLRETSHLPASCDLRDRVVVCRISSCARPDGTPRVRGM